MIVVAWNLAIAGGGALGGMVLQRWGSEMLPWTLLPLIGLPPCWSGAMPRTLRAARATSAGHRPSTGKRRNRRAAPGKEKGCGS